MYITHVPMDLRTSSGRKELGRRIQSAIMGANFASLPEFAKKLGWSRALIYQYINGQVLVQLDRLQQIAEHTGKNLDWFLVADPKATLAEVAALEDERNGYRAQIAELERQLGSEREARLNEAAKHRLSLVDALRETCLAHRRLGDAASMLETAPRWMELAQQGGDDRAVMDANLQMGHAWLLTGEMSRAERALSAALTLATALGDARAEQSVRQEMVRVLQASGRNEEARQQALALAESELWWPRWSGLVSLAALAEQTGELDTAQVHLDAASSVVEEADEPAPRKAVARAYIVSNKANLALAHGRYRQALEISETLSTLAGQAGLPDQLREAALNLAVVALRLGKLRQASDHLHMLAEWAAMSGDRRLAALTKVFQSELSRRCGNLAEAKRLAHVAGEEATEARRGQILAETELTLGEVYWQAGQPDDARYHLTRCASRSEKLQLRRPELAAQLALSRIAANEQALNARDLLADVSAAISQHGYDDLHIDALIELARLSPPDRAVQDAVTATNMARAAGYFWGECGAMLAEAEAQLGRGQTDRAEKLLQSCSELKTRAATGLDKVDRTALLAGELSLQARLSTAYRNAGEPEKAARLE